jgi:predicted permease
MKCLELSDFSLIVIACLAVWEAIWKILAFWRAARNNHLAWFICIAIFNTVGILPIIYLLAYKKKLDE